MPTHNAEEWAGSGEALGSAVMKEEGPLTHPKAGHYKKALMRGLSCPSAFSSHKNGRGNLEAEGGRETIPLSLWVEDKVGKGKSRFILQPQVPLKQILPVYIISAYKLI